ncbi:MAG: RloB domain-containing protein [Clostridiales bacterium]|nr:RloB domain-containing protein [Clostridiales bacterium]
MSFYIPKNNVALICEGDTEYNYFNGFKRKCNSVLNVVCVQAGGGDYTNVLYKLKTTSPIGIVARFAIIDFDRYIKISGEQKNFDNLIDYCNNENKKGNPTFLIVTNPDFDYFVLEHKTTFNGKNKEQYIKLKCNYKNLDDFKSDEQIFEKFNKNGNEYKNAISKQNPRFPVSNDIAFDSRKYKALKAHVNFNKDNICIRTSNIKELFDNI